MCWSFSRERVHAQFGLRELGGCNPNSSKDLSGETRDVQICVSDASRMDSTSLIDLLAVKEKVQYNVSLQSGHIVEHLELSSVFIEAFFRSTMFAGEPVFVAKYVSEREQAARCMDVARSLWWTLLRENWPGNFSRVLKLPAILSIEIALDLHVDDGCVTKVFSDSRVPNCVEILTHHQRRQLV